MNILQGLVIMVALGVVLFGLGGWHTHVGRAWKKLGILALALAMIVVVFFPDSTNSLAHFVGVGRGADLLLYILVLAFIAFTLSNYLQHQDEKDALNRLTRKVALLEAQERYKIKQ